MSVAWVFPGQGSQYVGMATAWAAQSRLARDALAEAGDVLAFDVAGLIAEGPEDELADTYNQQPAVLAASVAILRAVAYDIPEPAFVAGHSLGEYGALVAAGAVDYAEALRLVRERGRLMRLAGERSPGGMAAVLGLDDDAVSEVCGRVAGVQVANFNAPGQVVISGETRSVECACELLEEEGARRIVRLPITIAAHSALMAPIADEFAATIEASVLRKAQVPVVANVSARPITGLAEIRDELASQLTAAVQWTATVRRLVESGVTAFYEIGPGTVLTGLIKRILRTDGGSACEVRPMGQPRA